MVACFPPTGMPDLQRGMAWFNALAVAERTRWLAAAKSAQPVDAWGAYLSQQAFQEAQDEGQNWLHPARTHRREMPPTRVAREMPIGARTVKVRYAPAACYQPFALR